MMASPRHCQIPPYDLGHIPHNVLYDISKQLDMKTELSEAGYAKLATFFGIRPLELWKLEDEVKDGGKAMRLIRELRIMGRTLSDIQIGLEKINSVAADIIPKNLNYIIEFVEANERDANNWEMHGGDPQENTEYSCSLGEPNTFLISPENHRRNVSEERHLPGYFHLHDGQGDFSVETGRGTSYSPTVIKDEPRPGIECPSNLNNLNLDNTDLKTSVTFPQLSFSDNADHHSNIYSAGNLSLQTPSCSSGCFPCTCSQQSSSSRSGSLQQSSHFLQDSIVHYQSHQEHKGFQQQHHRSHQQPLRQDPFSLRQQPCRSQQQPSTQHSVINHPPIPIHPQNNGSCKQCPGCDQPYCNPFQAVGDSRQYPSSSNEHRDRRRQQLRDFSPKIRTENQHQGEFCQQSNAIQHRGFLQWHNKQNQKNTFQQRPPASHHEQYLSRQGPAGNFSRQGDNLQTHALSIPSGHYQKSYEKHESQTHNFINGKGQEHGPTFPQQKSRESHNGGGVKGYQNIRRHKVPGFTEHKTEEQNINFGALADGALLISNQTSDEESNQDTDEERYHPVCQKHERRNKVQLISKRPSIFVTGGNCALEMKQIREKLKILEESLCAKIDWDNTRLTPGEGKWKTLFDQADLVLIGATKSYADAVKHRSNGWLTRPTVISEAVQREILHSRSNNVKFFTVIITETKLRKTDLPLEIKIAPYKWPGERIMLERRIQEKIQDKRAG